MDESEAQQRETLAAATRRLVAGLAALRPPEGISAAALPGVKLMHTTRHLPAAPISYEPSVVVIAQGRKIGRLGDRVFRYDPTRYLVLTVPLPFVCETIGSAEAPLLGLSVRVMPALVAELLLQMESRPPAGDEVVAVEAAPLDAAMAEAAARLVESLRTPEEARLLGPAAVREIVYRALRGPRGASLRALAATESHFGRISRVLQRLHTEFARRVEVDELAREAGMSPSVFHKHFKAVTAASPMQYLKAVRLHYARQVMVQEGETAAAAAARAGYESASQFSRDFKRHFGDTPGAAAAALRATLTQLA